MNKTLDQQRAEYAWIADTAGMSKDTAEKYLPLVKGASSFIMSNGLMQAMAFYESRENKREAQILNEQLLTWIDTQILLSTGRVHGFREVMPKLYSANANQ